jgi:hypothetical protein
LISQQEFAMKSKTTSPGNPVVIPDRFLNEYELADRHQRSVKTVRNDRVRGTGVPFVRIGRSVRYRLSDIVRYEAERLCTSTSSNGGEL